MITTIIAIRSTPNGIPIPRIKANYRSASYIDLDPGNRNISLYLMVELQSVSKNHSSFDLEVGPSDQKSYNFQKKIA
jgi:hypothetical protein